MRILDSRTPVVNILTREFLDDEEGRISIRYVLETKYEEAKQALDKDKISLYKFSAANDEINYIAKPLPGSMIRELESRIYGALQGLTYGCKTTKKHYPESYYSTYSLDEIKFYRAESNDGIWIVGKKSDVTKLCIEIEQKISQTTMDTRPKESKTDLSGSWDNLAITEILLSQEEQSLIYLHRMFDWEVFKNGYIILKKEPRYGISIHLHSLDTSEKKQLESDIRQIIEKRRSELYSSEISFKSEEYKFLCRVPIYEYVDKELNYDQSNIRSIHHTIENSYDVSFTEKENQSGRYGWIVKGDPEDVPAAVKKLTDLVKNICTKEKTYQTDDRRKTIQEHVEDLTKNSPCSVTTEEVKATWIRADLDLRREILNYEWKLPSSNFIKIINAEDRRWLCKESAIFHIKVKDKPSLGDCFYQQESSAVILYIPAWKSDGKEKHTVSSILDTFYKKKPSEKPKSDMPLVLFLSELTKQGWSCRPPRIKITVKTGEMAKLTSDAIVNSANENLTLITGVVSKSILLAAGQNIQDECTEIMRQRRHKQLDSDEVVVSGGHNLKCRYVFHGSLASWGKQTLAEFVYSCLREADLRELSSISFPSLGTGNKNYPRDNVAAIMFQTVQKYDIERNIHNLKVVDFVIYEKDDKALKAFKTAEDGFKKGIVKEEKWLKCPNPYTVKVTVTADCESTVSKTFSIIEENLKTNTKIGVLNPEEPKSQTILRTEIETKPYSDESFTEEEKADIADLKQWSGSEGNPTFKHHKDTIEPAVEATENIGEPCYVNVRINDDDRSKIYVNLVKVLHKYGIKEENIIWCPFTPSEARIYFHNDSAADMLLANMKPEEKYELKKSNIDAVVNVRAKLNASVSLYLVESKQRIEELRKQSGVDVINEDNGTVILTGDLRSISSARDILLKWKNRSFDQKALTNTIDKNDQGKGDMPGSDDQTDGGFQFKGKGDTNHDPERMRESSFQSENRDSYPKDQPETKDAVRQSMKNNSHGKKEIDESYSQTRMDGLNILNDKNSSNKQYKNADIDSNSMTNVESGKGITQHQVKTEKSNKQFTEKTNEPEQMKPIDKNDGNEKIKPGGNFHSVRPKEYNDVKQTTRDPKLDSQKRDLGVGNKAKRGHTSSNDKFLFLEHNTNPTTTSEMDEENLSEEPISPSPDTFKELKCFPIVDDDSLMMTTKEKIKVYVYQGKLCYLNVQGIVNSSNESMNHSSGLFSVIAKEAGEKMIDECQSYLTDKTILQQGKVCVTTAGDLKHYSYILHACAPIWAKRKDTESYIDGLMNVIRNALISADDTKLRSVAIPAIGSGGRGGPKQVCFSSFPRAIAQYRSKHGKTSSLKEVHFVDQDPEVVTLMQTAFLLALDESRRGKDSKLMKIPLKIKNTFLCYVGSESGPTRYQTLVLPNNVNVFLCDGPLFSVPRHRHGRKCQLKRMIPVLL
ncbi:PARP10_14_15 [Mytilus edulis]|uniref:PARP10_14_15 n=1 Tax=Mytilus edulis TaxID=6550 RepID=A0A8S3UUP3_MYTED|nr:PARP10_14_15 [Mytilus edulis]